MSYISWSNNGYGICTSEIATTVDRVWKLLEQAPLCEQYAIDWATWLLEDNNIRTSDMSIQEIKDSITLDNFENDFESPDSCISYYLATILKAVIGELEGIRLLDCSDFDGKQYLIMPDAQIWQLNETEKTMTMFDYDVMFATYLKILTDQYIEVDYQEVQNGN